MRGFAHRFLVASAVALLIIAFLGAFRITVFSVGDVVAEGWKTSALEEVATGSWFKTLGGNSTEWAYSIGVYGDYVCVTGTTSSFDDMEGFVACLSTSDSILQWFKTGVGGDIVASGESIYVSPGFLASLSASSGSLLWSKTIGNSSVGDIYVSGDNMYITGGTEIFGNGESDVFVACLSASNGGLQWFEAIGGTGSDNVFAIAVSGDNICITGNRYHGGLEDPYDVFVACFSPDGDLRWFKTIQGNDHDEAHGIAVSGDSIYITGGTKSFGVGECSAYVASLTASDGSFRWFKTIGGTGYEFAYDIALHGERVYTTGQTSSFGAGEGDAFVACLASNGGLQWFRTIGGTGLDLGNGIAVYGDSIYITGPSKERFRRSNNAFVAKLGLEYISSEDPWDMEWTSDEQCPPIYVDGANPSVTAPTPTLDSHSLTVQTQSPTVTAHTLTISQQYPETHTAVPKEDVTPLEDLDVTLPTVSLSIDPSQPDTTQTVTFTVTAHDNTGGIGIAEIRIYVDYASPAKIWTTPGTYIYTGGPYTREPVDLHVYWVEAVDYAGNLARKQGVFTVSASPLAPSPHFPWEWAALAVSVIGAVATLTFVIIRRRTRKRHAISGTS